MAAVVDDEIKRSRGLDHLAQKPHVTLQADEDRDSVFGKLLLRCPVYAEDSAVGKILSPHSQGAAVGFSYGVVVGDADLQKLDGIVPPRREDRMVVRKILVVGFVGNVPHPDFQEAVHGYVSSWVR
jgi:hypothetical protein